ncbi:MAG: hypothetical protein ACLT3H_12390 [Roseburia sp.]
MPYIDWEYYNSHFKKVEQDEFETLLPQAEAKVEIYTHFRCKTATGYKMGQVQAAVANLVNAMADHNSTGAGSGVASVSNDGYSESYTNVTKEQADKELRGVCAQWLSGTGLMGCL